MEGGRFCCCGVVFVLYLVIAGEVCTFYFALV
jgi:hypothetical protein